MEHELQLFIKKIIKQSEKQLWIVEENICLCLSLPFLHYE